MILAWCYESFNKGIWLGKPDRVGEVTVSRILFHSSQVYAT